MTELFFPERAAESAGQVDAVYLFLVGVSGFFTLLIFTLLLVFAIRYRRRHPSERPRAIHGDLRLELVWMVIPFILTMVMFGWGAKVYVDTHQLPADADQIYVTGKQWMWIIQHPTGQREINELHIPRGRAVKLTMISEDVIHDFYVPAFRIKQDVVPGHYSAMGFTPTRTGSYHLFCAEYCGTNHSLMIGKVVVMDPVDYEDWLSGGGSSEPLAQRGERLFNRMGCATCHGNQPTDRGPSLTDLFGSTVQLADGQAISADEDYIRESILEPNARKVAGFEPIMPTYQGQINEEGLIQILAYIKSLTSEPEE